MAAFRFRLAPVLRLRDRHREAQRLAFAEVEEERIRLLEEIQQLEHRSTACAQEMLQTDGKSLTVADLQLYGEFAQQLARLGQHKRAVLAAVDGKREEQRLALLEADKEVKSLEQLRSRLEERVQHEETASMQRQADEVGQRRYLERQQAMERNDK